MNKIVKDIETILINNFKFTKKDISNFKNSYDKINNWDSLKHLQFIMLLEKKFNIKFPFDQNFNLKSIDDFVKIIKKLNKKS